MLGWQTNNTNIFYQILVIGVSLLHIICIILFIVLRWREVILGLWSPQNSLDFFRFLILILLFRKIGTGILPHIGRSSLRPLGSSSHLPCFWAWKSFGKNDCFTVVARSNYLVLVKMLLATLHWFSKTLRELKWLSHFRSDTLKNPHRYEGGCV